VFLKKLLIEGRIGEKRGEKFALSSGEEANKVYCPQDYYTLFAVRNEPKPNQLWGTLP